MPTFLVTIMSTAGQEKSVLVKAETEFAVVAEIKKHGLFTCRVIEEPNDAQRASANGWLDDIAAQLNQEVTWWDEGGKALSSSSPDMPVRSEQRTKDCPYCAEVIQANAVKCKHCGEFLDGRRLRKILATSGGEGKGRKCPYCGAYGVGKVRGLQGMGEVVIAAILMFLCIIPAVVYYVSVESVPYCSSCGRRVSY